MKKQILSILMTTSMIFTLSPATTLAKEETIKVKEEVTSKQLVGTKLTQWAEENVTLFSAEDTSAAKIGDEGYPTLQDAIERAIQGGIDNVTVTLLKDLDEAVSIHDYQIITKCTIDLNGHTLKGTEGGISIIHYAGTSGKQLTIKNSVSDKGGITSAVANPFAITNYSSGTINLENIKISGVFSDAMVQNLDASGVININGGIISGKSLNARLISNHGFLNINGGTISTENNEVVKPEAIDNDGILTIEGSTIFSYDFISIYNEGTITSIKNSVILGPIVNSGGQQPGGNQVHGDATIRTDIEIPSRKTLDIPKDAKLTIPKGVTLNISDGATIINKGTIDNSLGGKIVGSKNITSSDGGQVLEPADTTAPIISSITPSGKDVLTTGKIAITFNEEMDTTSIGTVKLNDTTTLDKSTGTWSVNTYTIDYASLASATDYTINVSGFEDKVGNVMVEDKSHTFTTASNQGDYTYKVVSGGDATWDGKANLVFKIDGDFDTFKDIKLNDKVIDKADYTIERGSVILTLKPAYLKTLPAGTHRLNVLFEGNEVETSFTIKETPTTPGKEEPITPDKETPITPGKEEPTNKETPTTANKEEPVIKKSASQDTTSQNNIQNGCMIVLLACLVGVVAYRKKEN